MRRALLTCAAAILPTVIRAQTPKLEIQREVRADAIVSRWTAVQGAAGFTIPAGLYVRSGLAIGAGGGAKGFDSRVDVFSRFNLDPFREKRWGLYGGGGISARYSERDNPETHAYLLVFAGVEGPLGKGSVAGWVPAFEIGLGGGTRIGVAFRQGIPRRR